MFLLHTMADTFALTEALDREPTSALIVGAGYIGVEMAEALSVRGLRVTQVEALPEVLPTVDPELRQLVRQRIQKAGVDVVTGVTVSSVRQESRLVVEGSAGLRREVDLVLVVVGYDRTPRWPALRRPTQPPQPSTSVMITLTRITQHNADDSSPDHGESITSREPSSMSGHRGARSRVGGL